MKITIKIFVSMHLRKHVTVYKEDLVQKVLEYVIGEVEVSYSECTVCVETNLGGS
jgi:hypothetical protein